MTTNPYGVVFAKLEDADAIFEHLMKLHAENGLFPVNADKVRAEIHTCLTPDANGRMQNIIGLIRGKDRKIEASIGLTLSEIWYSDCVQLMEKWIFVESEYRATPHAKNLVSFAKWYADCLNKALEAAGDGQQVVPLSIGILTLKSLEPKKRLYQRMGLQQIGATFLYPDPANKADFYNERKVTPKQRTRELAA